VLLGVLPGRLKIEYVIELVMYLNVSMMEEIVTIVQRDVSCLCLEIISVIWLVITLLADSIKETVLNARRGVSITTSEISTVTQNVT
jgi:hypothetical protein